ncbi:Flavin-dependent tryptophan halogenase PrnA (plasmid) [Asticcacaulis sp. MM231]|uniref:tryptophan 7-halogenase n=1 Tax=Asticcacaulis sp. MM231 TaxID=3157666 RepID=UPI0032D5A03D
MTEQTATPSDPGPQHIVLYGSGLAAQMTAAALAHQAPASLRITWLGGSDASATDVFYGSVTPPSAYDFNLAAGVSEPQLVLQSNTAFSFGTLYKDWGLDRASWAQTFQLPFPILEGVPFQHYLTQQAIYEIEPYLASAVAGRRGVFAHPPEGQGHALSRAEYGYQIEASSYGAVFERAASGRVTKLAAAVTRIDQAAGEINALHLADGQRLTADLYVDCSGPEAQLISTLGVPFNGDRRLGALADFTLRAELGAPLRTVTGDAFGWSAETTLQGKVARLVVFDPDSEDQARQAHEESAALQTELTLGHHDCAWSGNCVAIGQAAAVVEPVTPAPLILLQRDIQRLLNLLPVSRRMSVERKAFNRGYVDDYQHAGLFNRALFEGFDFPDTPYWHAARLAPVDERLTAKIEQFESRGLHVAFDLEPFTPEDWIILHYGMGRRPARHDRVVDRASREKVAQYLLCMRRDIDQAVNSMPSHSTYMQGLARFLKQQSLVTP